MQSGGQNICCTLYHTLDFFPPTLKTDFKHHFLSLDAWLEEVTKCEFWTGAGFNGTRTTDWVL